MKTRIRISGDKVYANYLVLNVPKDDIESKSFEVICIDSLLVYENKYYLQIYLDNCANEIINQQMAGHLDHSLLEDQILKILYYDRLDISKGIDLAKSSNNKERMSRHFGFLIMDSNFKILYAMVAMI